MAGRDVQLTADCTNWQKEPKIEIWMFLTGVDPRTYGEYAEVKEGMMEPWQTPPTGLSSKGCP